MTTTTHTQKETSPQTVTLFFYKEENVCVITTLVLGALCGIALVFHYTLSPELSPIFWKAVHYAVPTLAALTFLTFLISCVLFFKVRNQQRELVETCISHLSLMESALFQEIYTRCPQLAGKLLNAKLDHIFAATQGTMRPDLNILKTSFGKPNLKNLHDNLKFLYTEGGSDLNKGRLRTLLDFVGTCLEVSSDEENLGSDVAYEAGSDGENFFQQTITDES